MGLSLVKICIHMIFSTLNRVPFINEDIENELYDDLRTECTKLDSEVYAVGGYFDHVHLLCTLPKKIALIKFMEDIKKNTSSSTKKFGSYFEHFYWHDGYTAVSVCPSKLRKNIQYIENQKDIHRYLPYKDELKMILKENGLEYDERYLWR